MDVNREVGSRLVKSGGYLINLQAKALLLPWHLCRVWLAGSVNILLALFHLMIAELNRHIDNMHQREEEYRRRVQVLSEQLELQSKDKSKAIKKLNRVREARSDAQDLLASLDGLQRSASRRSLSGEGGAPAGNTRLSHSLLWGAVLAVCLCSGTLTSLELKLLLSVTVPVVLMYFMMQTSDGHQPPGWKTVAIQCVSAGVLGFTLNHLVC